jgi:molecular chaperone HtpG
MPEIKIGARLLETLTTALYQDPIVLFREYVQNSLDAYNTATDNNESKRFEGFFVDIKIDKKDRKITISDNGYGIPEKEFHTKMTTIGSSPEKSKSKDQIGFRGIGRLSAMPLCKRLEFINKPKGLDRVMHFTWDGARFNELLNQEKEPDFDNTVSEITNTSDQACVGNIDEHFFIVEIHGYGEEIADSIADKDFEDRLRVLLPLKYSPEFTYQEKIKSKYADFMGQSPDKFSIVVKLDSVELCKPYLDKDVLDSGIVFWELRYPSRSKETPGDKIGILWFSFNKQIKARDKNEIYGILVRSKNMLMGDQYSLATAIIHSKTDYITTPRELTQTLNGVTGEMLIHSTRLHDNARRDWFRIDDALIQLRHIIVEFMRRLHTYRYAASGYFGLREKAKREEVIKAYTDLTNFNPEIFVKEIDRLRDEISANREIFKFADEDIPSFSITTKRFYERLIKCLYEYFSAKKRLEELILIRKVIKTDLNKESTG